MTTPTQQTTTPRPPSAPMRRLMLHALAAHEHRGTPRPYLADAQLDLRRPVVDALVRRGLAVYERENLPTTAYLTSAGANLVRPALNRLKAKEAAQAEEEGEQEGVRSGGWLMAPAGGPPSNRTAMTLTRVCALGMVDPSGMAGLGGTTPVAQTRHPVTGRRADHTLRQFRAIPLAVGHCNGEVMELGFMDTATGFRITALNRTPDGVHFERSVSCPNAIVALRRLNDMRAQAEDEGWQFGGPVSLLRMVRKGSHPCTVTVRPEGERIVVKTQGHGMRRGGIPCRDPRSVDAALSGEHRRLRADGWLPDRALTVSG